MTTSADPPAASSIPPPPKAGTRAIGRRPRMHRFLYILIGLTALAHVAPAIGVAELARRLGASQPWLWSGLLLVLGVALFLGRARAGMADTHRAAWIVNLV